MPTDRLFQRIFVYINFVVYGFFPMQNDCALNMEAMDLLFLLTKLQKLYSYRDRGRTLFL